MKTTLHRLQLTHVASADSALPGAEDKVLSPLGPIPGSTPKPEASLSTLARSYTDLHITNRHLSIREVVAAVGVCDCPMPGSVTPPKKRSTHDITPALASRCSRTSPSVRGPRRRRELTREWGMEIRAMVIGEGEEHQDLYGDWLRQREMDEDGVILVRPDRHIGWCAHQMVEDPTSALAAVLATILTSDHADNPRFNDADLAVPQH